MHPGPFIRRAAAIGGMLAVTFGVAPAASFAAQAPAPSPYPNNGAACTPKSTVPCHVDLNVSDTGFDQKSLNVVTWVFQWSGTITVHNTGTQVHTATAVPGSGGWGVSLVGSTDGQGGVQDCWARTAIVGAGSNKCGVVGVFDTGGINPGGSVTYNFNWGSHQASSGGQGPTQAAPTIFQITSATDCLNGNSNPNFDCSPVAITVKSIPNPVTTLSKLDGSNFDVPGSADCLPDVPTIIPSVGPAMCLTTAPVHRTIKGPKANAYAGEANPKAQPLSGNVTVTIDDINGFQPTDITVTGGTTVTWVNNGLRVHSITFGGPANPNNNFGQLASQTLATLEPGQTAQQNFDCSLGFPVNTCTYTVSYHSNVKEDLIPLQFDGNRFTGATPANGGVISGVGCGNNKFVGPNSADTDCGNPAFNATVYVVPPSGFAPSF